MTKFYESDLEKAAIGWFKEIGYHYEYGPDISPSSDIKLRKKWDSALLPDVLLNALYKINPDIPQKQIEEAHKAVLRQERSVEKENHQFQKWLTQGIPVMVRKNGVEVGKSVYLVDFNNPDNNEWMVTNQVTFNFNKTQGIPDVLVYLNGMCISVFELKNPIEEDATLENAWNQIQFYKSHFPSLFYHNEINVISDGIKAKLGSLTAGKERYMPWRTIDGENLASADSVELEVLIKGVFNKTLLLDYLRNFVICNENDGYIKMIAGYHQFHATRKAITQTLRASAADGDGRIGVIWHTQGSGKSISMVCYTGKVMRETEMNNPTIVVLTDRNDLDGQLFSTFSNAQAVLPYIPVQAESREHLRKLLTVASGGIIFTTIQKWSLTKEERTNNSTYPVLTDRKNVIVIADEAHRSQYGFDTKMDDKTGEISYGLARNIRDGLPNSAFIGFTGTPIEFEDKSTRAVFGEYIDTYTITQSVEDGATVPIYYEGRLVKLDLSESKDAIDINFDEVTEDVEQDTKSKLKAEWSRLEAMVGTESRLEEVRDDLLAHWERRKEIQSGKAMVVCMSRRICVDLYEQIKKKHPDWTVDDDAEGRVKVIMTGASSDPKNFHPHIRSKAALKDIEKRFKDPDDPLEMVIVRDMWLTGFDAPCANTLYMDKPMRGHGLMQAIARVNRVFKDKPNGLVVDYLGIAESLRSAVKHYGKKDAEKAGADISKKALPLLEEKFEVVKSMLHAVDYSGYFTDEPAKRIQALAKTVNFIVSPTNEANPDELKDRFMENMSFLNKAYGMAMHLEAAAHMRDEIAFFQAVQKVIRKNTVSKKGQSASEMSGTIKDLVAKSVKSEGVIDIFAEAGIPKPDISILSEQFLESAKNSPYKNLQLELLRKLLNDEIRLLRRSNIVQSRLFSEMLIETMNKYHNRSIKLMEAIIELINLAKSVKESAERGEDLGLNSDEMAFYDALCAHGDAKNVMGEKKLAAISLDLVKQIRKSVTIDWTRKESVRAHMRVKIKRLLRKHGYPPDKNEEATETVIEQAEVVYQNWDFDTNGET